MTNNTPDYEDNLYFEEKKMENIDKEPTYYVSLTEYNEVKRMFLKANDEINTLKELLEECKDLFVLEKGFMVKCIREKTLSDIIAKIDEALR